MAFRDKVYSFMRGRYGNDQLNNAILWLCAAATLVNIFVGSWIIYLPVLALFGWNIFRALSRNIYARNRENDVFMKGWRPVKSFFVLQYNRIRYRKTHVYRSCPQCHTTLRLPRRPGEHTVACPRCSRRFSVKVR